MALPVLPGSSAQAIQQPANVFDPTWYFFLAQLLRAVSDRTTMVTSTTAPTTTDIPVNESRVWRNTTAGTVRLYVNDSGVLKSVLMS